MFDDIVPQETETCSMRLWRTSCHRRPFVRRICSNSSGTSTTVELLLRFVCECKYALSPCVIGTARPYTCSDGRKRKRKRWVVRCGIARVKLRRQNLLHSAQPWQAIRSKRHVECCKMFCIEWRGAPHQPLTEKTTRWKNWSRHRIDANCSHEKASLAFSTW